MSYITDAKASRRVNGSLTQTLKVYSDSETAIRFLVSHIAQYVHMGIINIRVLSQQAKVNTKTKKFFNYFFDLFLLFFDPTLLTVN